MSKQRLGKEQQNKEKEVEFFDAFTQDKEYDVLYEYGYQSLITEMIRLAGDRCGPNRKIIDCGCGTGSFTRRMAQRVESNVSGVDISANSIKVAQSKGDDVHYFVGDIEKLKGIEPETYDVVVYSAVLHHFQDISGPIREGYRILKPKGALVAFDPHLHSPFMWLYRHPDSPCFSSVGKTDNEQLLSTTQMHQVLRDIGFQNTQAYGVSGVLFKYVESKLGRLLLPIYNALDYLLGHTPLSRKIGTFIISCGEKP